MLKFEGRALSDARIVIDGSGSREFKLRLARSIKVHSHGGAVRTVKMRDSQSEPLLQLADMCVGAIARSYRADRDDAARWAELLRPKIDNVWEFK